MFVVDGCHFRAVHSQPLYLVQLQAHLGDEDGKVDLPYTSVIVHNFR